METTTLPRNNSIIAQIRDLFQNSNATNSSTSMTHDNMLKHSNRILPLIFICGTAFAILICCIVAKFKKNRKDNDSDMDDSYGWGSIDDDVNAMKSTSDKMLEHKATCHDHMSHYKYQPQLHGGHYNINQKNFVRRGDNEYEKVNSGSV